jgi:hypothetical protein
VIKDPNSPAMMCHRGWWLVTFLEGDLTEGWHHEFIATSPTKGELVLFWGAAIAIFFFLWVGMVWWTEE